MSKSDPQNCSVAKIAVMGSTGTGKSTFINLLTNDNRIHVGHDPESDTLEIRTAHYTDKKTAVSVMLIDTPGFDDSRVGVTDTDILHQIVHFLEPYSGSEHKLNGIIYMHRISDPRVGGLARKNLRMFQELCGDKILRNVRVVTTFWSNVSEQEGIKRQDALGRNTFKALLDAGAHMRRHDNTVESARQIMSELIPLPAVTTRIQEELRAGEKLEDTAAGSVLTEQIRELQKKHAEELANLKREMEAAWEERDHVLRADLEQERKALEKMMAIAEEDRRKLGRTLEQARADLAAERNAIAALREETEKKAAVLNALHDQPEKETTRLRGEMKPVQRNPQKEIQPPENRHFAHERIANRGPVSIVSRHAEIAGLWSEHADTLQVSATSQWRELPGFTSDARTVREWEKTTWAVDPTQIMRECYEWENLMNANRSENDKQYISCFTIGKKYVRLMTGPIQPASSQPEDEWDEDTLFVRVLLDDRWRFFPQLKHRGRRGWQFHPKFLEEPGNLILDDPIKVIRAAQADPYIQAINSHGFYTKSQVKAEQVKVPEPGFTLPFHGTWIRTA